jgi:membrane associated rhomboid family serine protease
MSKTSPYALGASGSTFGLLGAYAGFVYSNRRQLGYRSEFILDDIKKQLWLNVILGIINPRVDNFGHIGGFAGGALLSLFLKPKLRSSRIKKGSK